MFIKLPIIAFISLLTISFASFASESFSDDHEKVKRLFQSNEEKTAKDAIWTTRNIFKLGVFNDGTSRDGYALYVCSVLNDYGFKGKGVWVQIIDIVKLNKNGKWIKLGEARCQ